MSAATIDAESQRNGIYFRSYRSELTPVAASRINVTETSAPVASFVFAPNLTCLSPLAGTGSLNRVTTFWDVSVSSLKFYAKCGSLVASLICQPGNLRLIRGENLQEEIFYDNVLRHREF